jgi:hypothetical protein
MKRTIIDFIDTSKEKPPIDEEVLVAVISGNGNYITVGEYIGDNTSEFRVLNRLGTVDATQYIHSNRIIGWAYKPDFEQINIIERANK